MLDLATLTDLPKINEMLKTEKEFSILYSRLEKTIGDLEFLKGEKTFWTLSNLIIYLELPEGARMANKRQPFRINIFNVYGARKDSIC